MPRRVLFLLVPLMLGTAALAQHQPRPAGHDPSLTPYAGFETRAIKALSDQQIQDLKNGSGM